MMLLQSSPRRSQSWWECSDEEETLFRLFMTAAAQKAQASVIKCISADMLRPPESGFE